MLARQPGDVAMVGRLVGAVRRRLRHQHAEWQAVERAVGNDEHLSRAVEQRRNRATIFSYRAKARPVSNGAKSGLSSGSSRTRSAAISAKSILSVGQLSRDNLRLR
jgi:hypothetical protein